MNDLNELVFGFCGSAMAVCEVLIFAFCIVLLLVVVVVVCRFDKLCFA